MPSPDTDSELDSRRLNEWLKRHIDGYDGPLAVSRFGGGQSNPTYKLHTPAMDYVLRRKPSGDLIKGAHAIDREFRVTKTLASRGFPVAMPHAYCVDDSVIGTEFYVMDLVVGRIFWNSIFDSVSCEQRSLYFDAMNATLAALHSIEPESIGLQDYGRPGNYFSRQICRWSKLYLEETSAGRDTHMDLLLDWLPQNIPHDEGSSLVHGDFRVDNMIFDASQPTVRAVLDWELSHSRSSLGRLHVPPADVPPTAGHHGWHARRQLSRLGCSQ